MGILHAQEIQGCAVFGFKHCWDGDTGAPTEPSGELFIARTPRCDSSPEFVGGKVK